ncbi:MAG: hypothetical protein QXL22_01080 [Candidatus Nezhaarchaeales archaeon]
MSLEYQVLERLKSRVASVRANWGLPATTPLIDRVLTATAQIRARVATVRRGVAPVPPAPAPTATEYYPGEYYQVPPEEEPKVK